MLTAALTPCIAAAALGEPEASVQTDASHLRGSNNVTEHVGFRVHEIQLPSGTAVREFVGADGQVFAVAWRGPAPPNLRQMLGRFFEPFVAAAGARRTDPGHLQVRTADLVVQSGGHMRAFAGRAYLPQSVPNGVDLGELH
ncbi:MAG: DUF2844 domain-containing protein [Steroidobacteraceae bacterium]